MKPMKLDHISFNVPSIQKSMDFLRLFLSFEVVSEVEMLDKQFAYLRTDAGELLELTERPDCHTLNRPIKHIAFAVENLSEIEALCDRNGVEIILCPKRLDPIGKTVMVIKSPDGQEIEFCESIE